MCDAGWGWVGYDAGGALMVVWMGMRGCCLDGVWRPWSW